MPPKLVYIHIGKTAGTSLRTTLSNAFGPGSCSAPFVQNYITEEQARHYDGFRVICGHISRTDQLKWFSERRVITVLREPIDRCLSFIHYVRALPPDSSVVASDAHHLPVSEFIETEEAQRNLNNTMVRQLGGHMLDEPVDFPGLLKKAKETLSEALWVGRQQTMEADLDRLGALLSCRLEMVRENLTPSRPRREEEDSGVMNRLRALNRYDIQLWEWAAASLPAGARS